MQNLKKMLFSMGCVIVLLPAISWGASSVSQFGITWTFDRDYVSGQFANGDHWVVGPVTIIDIDPASVDDGTGRIINGSMINPSPTMGRRQGYDSGMYGIYNVPEDYDSNLNAARQLPLTVTPGSSVVSAVSTPATDGRTQLQTAAILTVLNSPAPAGSFRPPYVNVMKDITFNKNQLNYSLLQELNPVHTIPRLKQQAGDGQNDSVERMFERPWLDHIPGWIGRSHHPLDNMDDYDRDICTQVGIAALMLHLDVRSASDFSSYGSNEAYKETLLIRLVQIGIDNYGVIQDGGRENWLQDSGRKFLILFAGLMLNNADMKAIGEKTGDYAYTDPYGPGNPPPDLIRFEEDEMTFYVTQADVDLTHSSAWDPDNRAAELLPYEQANIGLPEWGIVRLYSREAINKYWGATYRGIIGPACGGFVLAVRIMGAKYLWNHDALFDYQDRFMEVEEQQRSTSAFIEEMWDAYRANYGGRWTRYDQNDIYSNGFNTSASDTIPPLAPRNLVTAGSTESTITLSWTAPVAAADGDLASQYKIVRDTNVMGYVSNTTFKDIGLNAGTTYEYNIYSIDDAGNQSITAAEGSFSIDEFPLDPEPDSIQHDSSLPEKSELKCYNNVFNPSKGEEATIRIELNNQAKVKVIIYDNKGKEIKKVMDEEKQPGFYSVKWNGKDAGENAVGSGIYMVQMKSGGYTETKKIAVVK